MIQGAGAGAFAQVATLVAQLAYTGLTARAFDPGAFGKVAVALGAAGLVSQVFGSGLAPAVMRSELVESVLLAVSFARATRAGAYAGATLVLIAWPWSHLWSAPDAVTYCLLATLGAIVTPMSAVSLAHLRRASRHVRVAQIAIIAGLGAIAVGAAGVVSTKSPQALMIPMVLTPWLTTIGCRLSGVRVQFGFGRDTAFGQYSRRSTQLSVVNYSLGQVSSWGTSRLLGVSALGLLNRADMLAGTSLGFLSTSFTTVAFAEYRRVPEDRIQSFRNQSVVLVSTLTAVVAGGLSLLAPAIVQMVLGGGPWIEVEALLPLMLLAYWFAGLSSMVGGMLQQAGHFRILRQVQSLFAIGVAVQLVALALFRSLPILLLFGSLTQATLLTYSLSAASRTGILGLRAVVPPLAGAVAVVGGCVAATEALRVAL